MRIQFRCALLAAAVVVVALWLVGCDGEKLVGLGMDDEIKLGQQAGDQFEAQYGRNTDPELVRLIDGLGERISAQARPPDYPYDYRVLNNNQINANAFPGGRIYIWTGLINKLGRNPDQLAFVVGHETTHVAHRHAVKAVERSMGYNLIAELLLGGANSQKYGDVVIGLMMNGYSRQEEAEADQFGVKFAHDAGYDPTACYAVIHAFQSISGEPNRMELLFNTHPGNNDRLNSLRAEVERNHWTGRYNP